MDAGYSIAFLGVWIIATFVVNILTLYIVKDIREKQVEEGKKGEGGDWNGEQKRNSR